MKNTLELCDLISGGNSFNMTNIADLSPDKDFYSYNHKVIYTTVIKNSRGGGGNTNTKWAFNVSL